LFERGSGESDRAEKVTVPSSLLVLTIGGAVLGVSPGERKSELEDLLLLLLRGGLLPPALLGKELFMIEYVDELSFVDVNLKN